MNSLEVKASVFNMPKTDVVSDGNVTIGSEYTFVPQFNSNTQVQTFGGMSGVNWRNLIRTVDGAHRGNFIGIDVARPGYNTNSLKGNIGVRYTNVGFYNGKSIDLRITVNDWNAYGDNTRVNDGGNTHSSLGNISFETGRIAMITQGYNWVDIVWEYVETGTNTLVPVSGYLTFSDIDASQGIQFTQSTVNKIDRLLVEDRSNVLQYQNNNGAYRIFDTTDIDVADSEYDSRYAITFLYSNETSLGIRWSTDWNRTVRNGRGFTPSRLFYMNIDSWTNGEYFFYVNNKPAPTDIPSPTKEVSHTVVGTKEQLTYNIYHTIPQEDPRWYYNAYRLEDQLDSALSSVEAKVFDENGVDRSAWFNIYTGDNNVRAIALASTLRNPDFYGHTYRLEIKSVLNPESVRSNFTNGQYIIQNQANALVNESDHWSNTVRTDVLERTLTVRHIDEETGVDILDPVSYSMLDGEEYELSPYYDLKYQDKYDYFPVSEDIQRGTINGNDVTVNFYYKRPNTDIGFEKIQIYTAKANEGLPINLDFNVIKINEVWQNDQVTVRVHQEETNDLVLEGEFTTAELDEGIELLVPSDYLSINTDNNYVATIHAADSRLTYIDPLADTIDTRGYTSSEQTVEAEAGQDTELSFEGIVMTERNIDEKMATFNEYLTLPVTPMPGSRSGYGFELNQEFSYENELGVEDITLPDEFMVIADSSIVDGDFYETENGLTTIPLVHSEAASDNQLTRIYDFPQVFIERETGNILQNRESEEDRDGRNNIYIPIWIDDLGVYDFTFENTEPLGVHHINLQIHNEIDVFAYMYAHMDSETVEDDAILISPVDVSSPFSDGIPNGWTESDLEWLQNN